MRLAAWMALAALPAGAQFRSEFFVGAEVCSDCHARLYPPGVAPDWSGMTIVHRGERAAPVDPRSVAPYALWKGSMMAHAAADPYWRAKVRYETARTPGAAKGIENACLSCHAPAQQYERRAAGGLRFDELNAAGLEGVTCTVCHQMDAANLGRRASFTAGFAINGRREIYGPHENPFPMPMRMHTGRTPAFAAHMLEAGVCGTCHTVITPVLDGEGRERGEFLEQATFLEWRASAYPGAGKTCQGCHMPLLEDAAGRPAQQYIAHTPHGGYFGPTRPRAPFGQHLFGGANAQMLELAAEGGGARARRMLAGGLSLTVEAERKGGRLEAAVRLANGAGHKYPSGFPSRRLWLHVTVKDARGQVCFESGAWNPETGEIRSVEARKGTAEPHYDVISGEAQTQAYEMEMADAAGASEVSLMRAARTLKDNRLLPLGFAAGGALEGEMRGLSLAPAGVGGDGDFAAGGDTVRYRARLRGEGPWTVEAEALYQSVKPAHLRAMDAGRSKEEAAFLEAFSGARRGPAAVARAEARVR